LGLDPGLTPADPPGRTIAAHPRAAPIAAGPLAHRRSTAAGDGSMRFLALIGALAIVAAIGAAIYFFGGFYSVAESQDNPAIVDWALASVRGASVVAHGTEAPPANLDDAETVKAGAHVYSTIGCVNCHGGPPNANWAKWSEGLKPVPADLKVMAKERTAFQLFWAIKNGIKFTGMPSFGLAGASDQDLWSIVAFIKKLPSVSDDEYKAWTASP
jgi:mono/diheme cytochrome c family protein